MKIAINARHLLKDNLEGVGWYTFEIVRQWAQIHPEDQFYLFFDRAYDPAFITSANLIPVVLSPPARHPLLFIWWFEISVRRAIRRIRPDLFFSPDGFMPLKLPIPTVITIHDVAHRAYPQHIPVCMRWYYAFFMPRFIKQASRVVTVSNFSKTEIMRFYGLEQHKITVIPNGCRAIFKPAIAFPDSKIQDLVGFNEPYILYVGSIHPRKNLSVLIRAFALFKTQTGCPHRLLIVGRLAWKSRRIARQVQKTPYAEYIHLVQKIPDSSLAAITAHAAVSVYPSMYEGFGFPVLEGMYAEIPVIAARSSSLPEVGGEAVLYFDPHQPADLASLLSTVVTNVQLQKQLIEREKIQRGKFDWMKSSLQLYSIIKSEIPNLK